MNSNSDPPKSPFFKPEQSVYSPDARAMGREHSAPVRSTEVGGFPGQENTFLGHVVRSKILSRRTATGYSKLHP